MPQLKKSKNVRIRLDCYEPSTRQYRPLVGLSVLVNVGNNMLLARALHRSMLKWLQTEEWKKDITPYEAREFGVPE